jgi:hypothetical protein
MLAFWRGYRTEEFGTTEMNDGAVRLLGRPFDGGEVFVYGTVERLELLYRQALLILVADVNARFSEGIDQPVSQRRRGEIMIKTLFSNMF